jgi:hypothetical protein
MRHPPVGYSEVLILLGLHVAFRGSVDSEGDGVAEAKGRKFVTAPCTASVSLAQDLSSDQLGRSNSIGDRVQVAPLQ